MKKFIKKIQTVMEMMSSNEGTLFTYALAYSIIVGIAPFIIISVVFVGTYVYDVSQIIQLLQRYVPADLILPFVDYIQTSDLSNLWLIVSLLGVSIWVASKSIYSFLLLSSEQDGVNINHFFLRILACVYFIMIVLGIMAFGILIGYVPFINKFTTPIVITFFFVFFYRLLSFKYTRFRDVIWGSAITSIVLILLGRLFFVYINQYSNYQTIYGPLASMMILLISGWIIAWVVFFGYCINYVVRDDTLPVQGKNRLISILEKTNEKIDEREEKFIHNHIERSRDQQSLPKDEEKSEELQD
ncbi:YhjD/YihY/BrkB family envelope integrity protein [Erysipelothrix rhusiopathiae]|uniref:YihY/virulence factor BrkB family protein n=1 Tax=Erysipelothrix rhusiopathiae TaxID=1648 RepID=UPI000F4335EF|nr:YhjD/YihY/BrkB family envelope integrity protein [Erysipelothrix rhusiopathiae]AYV35054.1 YihY/virulence factor BrkB family protein [Erysipelothrix rhusiopathiae]MDE8081930.1 YhjD/YihY/BrkB family envelope integrity protein [Erysipelothrix rhusiopathiae]MDE8314858.1 YhjD/YihY/BrkB family envelope integrity protein [Erysipelothrix rhusiopathiae]MDE8329855.1 YhjD/YihY/BrkB family envelope integrity protein [Erysipelothrix rhusiopathiae]MDE8332794.1 YhjD/YihY/BrkB family envelope integrity pro